MAVELVELIGNLASLSLETRRIPDPHPYEIRRGKLYLPGTQVEIETRIRKATELDEREYKAFLRIQNWACSGGSGLVVWISPPHPERSTVTKVTLSQVERNFLVNRAVLLDLSTVGCIALAERLAGTLFPTSRIPWTFSPRMKRSKGNKLAEPKGRGYRGLLALGSLFEDVESLRETPLVINDWSGLISEVKSNAWDLIASGEDWIAKEIAQREAERFLLHEGDYYLLARRLEMLGPYQPSCPVAFGTAGPFETFFRSAYLLSEKYFDCPRCSKPIPSGFGISKCPHCGARKEDYQKCG